MKLLLYLRWKYSIILTAFVPVPEIKMAMFFVVFTGANLINSLI